MCLRGGIKFIVHDAVLEPSVEGRRRLDHAGFSIDLLDFCVVRIQPTMSSLLRRAGAGVAGVGCLVGAGVAVGGTSPGLKRSVHFWSAIAPFVVEHTGIKWRASAYMDDCSEEELHRRLGAFHQRTASQCVDTIIQLGGIYVKIGQFVSTMGAGILNDAYTTALRPLQDGVPPRSIEQVTRIIEESVGKPMSSLFESFDERPLGAASIAQAHAATLVGGQRCVVKVQYPEVAELYDADFNNLEIVVSYLMPENMPLIKGLRRRHSLELDFRTEASNLRECAANMQARGFEPALVRVPRVYDGSGLCTQHVLAMELFEGQSLASAIVAEQEAVAEALGLESAEALRTRVMRDVRKHFKSGGGAQGNGGFLAGLLDVPTLSAAAPLFRGYVALRQGMAAAAVAAWNGVAHSVGWLSCGWVQPGLAAPPHTGAGIDLGRVLRTLVHVHGCQLLLDGVYNADPHPGNVIVLPDGRLGLIDYGMVGRLGIEERACIARTVLALAAGDKEEVARIYHTAGYRACWHSGQPHGTNAVHRFASFHLDRIDLSPITTGPDGRQMGVMQVLKSTLETSVPDWIEQARRLGGLLIGVGSQTARPISLAHEWSPIAAQLLRQAEAEAEAEAEGEANGEASGAGATAAGSTARA